jgi:hypothetical protein
MKNLITPHTTPNPLTPRPHQLRLADVGYDILVKNGLCYDVSSERVGKSLTTILIVEKSSVRKNCLILTKKAAIPDWLKLLRSYSITKNYHVINYESAHKIDLDVFTPDIIVADEAHHRLSAYPKPSKTLITVGNLISEAARRNNEIGLPIIYLSATPHAESYSQLYHQLRISPWSPFREYTNFYKWFKHYGVPKVQYLGSRQIVKYDKTRDERIKPLFDKLTYGITRQEAGFTEEPNDIIHYVPLNTQTIDLISTLIKDELLEHETLINVTESTIPSNVGVPDTVPIESLAAEYSKIHQIEGGTLKVDVPATPTQATQRSAMSLILKNSEKIDYIKTNFGDTDKLAIMYHYQAEQIKLNRHFTNALILQADKFAEGISLKDIDHLVIYSMSWRTSKYIQRRARQADYTRKTPINVHYLLSDAPQPHKDKLISNKVYTCVAQKNINFNTRNAKLLQDHQS